MNSDYSYNVVHTHVKSNSTNLFGKDVASKFMASRAHNSHRNTTPWKTQMNAGQGGDNQSKGISQSYGTNSVPSSLPNSLPQSRAPSPPRMNLNRQDAQGFKNLIQQKPGMNENKFQMSGAKLNSEVKITNPNVTAGKSVKVAVSTKKEVQIQPIRETSNNQLYVSGSSVQNTARIQKEALKNPNLKKYDSSLEHSTMESVNEELIEKPLTQEEINEKNFKPAYAYFVLFIALAARIMVQWQRKGLCYSYGYTGLGDARNNPVYEIATAYPQLSAWYGALCGLIYTIPYSFFGLIAGKWSDKVNRKMFLGGVLILAGLTCGITGAVNSFFMLGLMRVFHALLNTSSNPLSFSLISDYFPPEKRATANSIIQAGNYLGVGVSSFSVLLISMFGWRAQYGIMAAISAILGLVTMFAVKEPERGRYLSDADKVKEAEKKAQKAREQVEQGNPLAAFVKNIGTVFTLPTAKNVLLASSLRNFGGIIVSSFLPVFFLRNFPAFKAEYAMLNALAQFVCGMTASLGGGILADKFEKKSYWTKALICMSGCALSFPLIALGTLTTGNFYLSMLSYALMLLVSGTYSGPAITMIQNTAPQDQQGNVVSVYFFAITLPQTISPAIFGWFANRFGCLANPAMYGPLITAFVAFSYLGSLPFWWKAGANYKKFMEDKDEENARLAAA